MDIRLIIISIIVVFLAVTLTLIKVAVGREKKIHEEGIEVDSVVSKIESRLDDGHRRYTSYVKYVGDDGIEHEAWLNVAANLPIGRKVRIKYLPPKYDYAVFISQEI